MTRVVQLIREQPEAMLRLTDSADAICQACPHLARQRCSRDKGAAARVTQRDVAVLRQLGVKAGTEISVGRAYTLVREKFTPEIMARETCAGCSWQHHGYCAEGLERLKSQDSPAASCDTPMEPA